MLTCFRLCSWWNQVSYAAWTDHEHLPEMTRIWANYNRSVHCKVHQIPNDKESESHFILPDLQTSFSQSNVDCFLHPSSGWPFHGWWFMSPQLSTLRTLIIYALIKFRINMLTWLRSLSRRLEHCMLTNLIVINLTRTVKLTWRRDVETHLLTNAVKSY